MKAQTLDGGENQIWILESKPKSLLSKVLIRRTPWPKASAVDGAMMLRCCSRLRSLVLHSRKALASSSSRRLLHYSPHPLQFSSCNRLTSPLFNASSSCPSTLALHAFRSSPLPSSLVQVRHVSSRERKKRRKPMTPVTSKIKKFKMKFYSSYKSRFRLLNDGTIRRWKEGKRHNAHLKVVSGEF